MRFHRLIILLVILFFASFWWAGGNAILPAATSFKSDLPLQQTLTVSGHAATFGSRLYRIIFFKKAVAAKLAPAKKDYVPLKNIPLPLQQAVIAVEDNRFYHHFGLDMEGIFRAALVNLQTGSVLEGGSTITQQLVKNLFLSQEQTMGRKLEEVLLALDMELHYSKDEILEMYLNTIYFGSNAYGIGPASHIYFAKPPSSLNLAECALLAGLPNAPSIYSPYVNYAAAKQRQAVVLAAMVRNGYIGPSLAQEARVAPLKLARQ
ncbi:transglycosylase [Lucifera butyrica]|uniref:Transglycosylase n=1 Tax=Lucifera butyrica TaxID=1351585 RepID=A0A498R3X3_9FIRM|nr:biosynthetic peptidoglycan transglycosylase [Lucifera butyrica]VBB04873.1 transglycosylase [Lucifera butyrica]